MRMTARTRIGRMIEASRRQGECQPFTPERAFWQCVALALTYGPRAGHNGHTLAEQARAYHRRMRAA